MIPNSIFGTVMWKPRKSKICNIYKSAFLWVDPDQDQWSEITQRIFDPRFARFCGRKEREIRNWICNLGDLSPTRAICTTASRKVTCFLLFDKLCNYIVQNLVVGSSNSDDGKYKTDTFLCNTIECLSNLQASL